MTAVTGDAVVQQVGGRPTISWWQVLRVILVLGWIAWAGLAWWAAPRESTADRARADLTAGHLTYYEWGDRWKNDGGVTFSLRAGLESTGGPGPILLWHTTDGRQHYAVVDNGTTDMDSLSDDGNVPLYSGPEAEALDAQLQAAAPNDTTELPVRAVLAGLAIAGVALFLWALVSAPDPVTGTKWFWFWLVSGVPLGLGLLWWLARERPWRPAAEPRPGPPGRDNRLKWWAGIGISILAGIAVGLALVGLRSVLGENLVPVAH